MWRDYSWSADCDNSNRELLTVEPTLQKQDAKHRRKWRMWSTPAQLLPLLHASGEAVVPGDGTVKPICSAFGHQPIHVNKL